MTGQDDCLPDSDRDDQRALEKRKPAAFGWILLGLVGGLVLALIFVFYGQPALLLEQMNLRYCG